MTQPPRAEGLAAAARHRRDVLLTQAERVVAAHEVTVTEPPCAASVMVELEMAVGGFCLAEVVVTEATVDVDGTPGWASIMGYDERAALAAAVLDGAASHGGEAGEVVGRLCEDALAQEEAQAAAQQRAVAATEVTPG